ncbi:hypothetical protein OAP20_01475 [Alphaproteobacteria bacterium]|nr:hypothetical protein [Alphaproteobacteria bacterium]
MKLNKSLISFFKYGFYFIVITYFNFAVAQVDTSNKKETYSNSKKLNIEVSNLEKPSLGSIGVKTKLNNIMGLDIWKSMNATNIVEHFSYIPDVVTSKSLQDLLIQLYLSSSNPPSGTSEEIIKFLETRLFKLKSSGQSEKLYQLINQLPDGERWNIWKQWIIEYELIGRQDQKACSYVYEESKNNSNHFWQTARIFCLSINNKVSQAEFILDLLKVKGFEDPIFENLFQIINNEKEKFELKNKDIQILPIHLIMMDTIKIPIKINYIAHLGIEYTESLLKLTYLTPKARSFLLDKKINFTFVSTDQIILDYKSVSDGVIDIENSISNYKKIPNGQSRANVWFSVLSIKDEVKKAETILNFLKLEMKVGRFYDSANLYLPILNKIKNSSLTKELNDTIRKINIASNPELYDGNKLANILMLKKDKEWDWNLILSQKAWPIIPVIERAGMIGPENIKWLDFINKFNQNSFDEKTYNKWNRNFDLDTYILSKSIEQAAKENKKSLTILLVARLVNNNPFEDFDLNYLLIIKKALVDIGFEDLANNITYEIMTSKIINF